MAVSDSHTRRRTTNSAWLCAVARSCAWYDARNVLPREIGTHLAATRLAHLEHWRKPLTSRSGRIVDEIKWAWPAERSLSHLQRDIYLVVESGVESEDEAEYEAGQWRGRARQRHC
jgi:hypothetical protein